MSVPTNTTVLRRWTLVDPSTGLPPASLSAATVKVYGPASAYNAVGPVLDPLWTQNAPAYTAATGQVSVTVPATVYTQPGLYRETLVATDGVAQAYAQSRAVLAQDATAAFVCTLGELRARTARLLGDHWTGQASAVSATSLVDADRWENDWIGEWLTCTTGTARGQERRVSAYDSATGTLSWLRAMSPAPTVGDRYELHRRFTVAEYNDALQTALLQASHDVQLPAWDETLLVTDALQPEYAIAPGLQSVSAIWTQDATATPVVWTELTHRDYHILTGRRTVRLATVVAGTRLRLQGHVHPERVSDDWELVDGPPEFLILKAAAHLEGSRIAGPPNDTDAAAARANLYHQQAEARRPKVALLPNAVRL